MNGTNKHVQLKRFGQHLRQLRQKAMLSLNDMATLCGMDKARLSRIENGRLNITLSSLELLATALGRPAYELVDIYEQCQKG